MEYTISSVLKMVDNLEEGKDLEVQEDLVEGNKVIRIALESVGPLKVDVFSDGLFKGRAYTAGQVIDHIEEAFGAF